MVYILRGVLAQVYDSLFPSLNFPPSTNCFLVHVFPRPMIYQHSTPCVLDLCANIITSQSPYPNFLVYYSSCLACVYDRST